MRTRSTILIALGGAALLSLAALAPALAQKGPGDPEPAITLRLLVQDAPGRQSEPAALDLARLAEELTGGAVTIEPSFEGGKVAEAVMAGEVDLGMVPSRDWDAAGVTSLDVLEAPFLIDNDALAVAIATSDIADRAMAGLEAVGVTGLAMWPEDLRHLFAFDASGADLTSLEGLADADILVVAGTPGRDLIPALGGRIYAEFEAAGELTGNRDLDARAGLLEGMVTGLKGAGLPPQAVTVAGDLVLYSKYQMLVANSAALGRLTDRQRGYLDEIVAAAHVAALGRHYAEADLATERCEAGGRVVALGETTVGAFKAAAQPLTDALRSDPVTGELMAAVEALAEATPASPAAGTCEPVAATPSDDASGYIGTEPPPDGTYRAEVTREDLLARGATEDYAGQNAGVWTWTLEGDRWSMHYSRTGARCAGSFEVVGDVVRQSDDPDPSAGCYGAGDYHWRPEGDGIRAPYVPNGSESPADLRNWVAFNDRVWSRIDGPGPASPAAAEFIGDQPVPAGTYRMSATTDDLEQAGATRDHAGLNQGTWTWTFTADGWSATHDVRNEQCSGGMTVTDGYVELSDTAEGTCGMGYQLRWRLEGDGIRFEVVGFTEGGETPAALANERAFINRIWSAVS